MLPDSTLWDRLFFTGILKSLKFVVTRFLMKLLKLSNTDVINNCRHFLFFSAPSKLLAIRSTKLKRKFMSCKPFWYL